jgi:hypothetical protein
MPSYNFEQTPIVAGKLILKVSYANHAQRRMINQIMRDDGRSVVYLTDANEGYLRYCMFEMYIPLAQAQEYVNRLRASGLNCKWATE